MMTIAAIGWFIALLLGVTCIVLIARAHSPEPRLHGDLDSLARFVRERRASVLFARDHQLNPDELIVTIVSERGRRVGTGVARDADDALDIARLRFDASCQIPAFLGKQAELRQ